MDISGNGILDLVVPDGFVGLYWFENDGQGNFSRFTIHENRDQLMERHAVADINGDGRPEIVIVDNINGSLLCFGFEGDPRDRRSWHHHTICEGTLPFVYDVTVADFDGDGRLDVAASSYKGNRFAWFQQCNSRWIQHLIEENIGETRTIVAGDIDGNGKTDLLATAFLEGQVIWYENPGNPANEPWRKHIIDEAPQPAHGMLADMTGTGSLDVVMALGMRSLEARNTPVPHQIVWYENDGSPQDGHWKKHVICDSLPSAFETVAADMDGDGRLDIVASAERGSNEVRWWRNAGQPHRHVPKN